jgi:hypothetical protein
MENRQPWSADFESDLEQILEGNKPAPGEKNGQLVADKEVLAQEAR